METSASFEARYAPLLYPTNQVESNVYFSGNLRHLSPKDVPISERGASFCFAAERLQRRSAMPQRR